LRTDEGAVATGGATFGTGGASPAGSAGGGAASAATESATGSATGAKERDTVATEATSAPQTEHEKRPGASGESHSGQTTVFVAIDHLKWKPDPPGPGL
jgi:hypothetical protein